MNRSVHQLFEMGNKKKLSLQNIISKEGFLCMSKSTWGINNIQYKCTNIIF